MGLSRSVSVLIAGAVWLGVPSLSQAAIPKISTVPRLSEGQPKAGDRARMAIGTDSLVQAHEFPRRQAERLFGSLMSRPPRLVSSTKPSRSIATASDRRSWLKSVYREGLVEASRSTELLADKLLMHKLVTQAMGASTDRFLPKTLGLKEFLAKHGLVDSRGVIIADGSRIESALYREFPAGFVVRPAVGVAPSETKRGLFTDSDQFVSALLSGRFSGYRSNHFRKPVQSHILKTIASGEAVVLQDDLILSMDARKRLQRRQYTEVRIHTFESRVVADAIPDRWYGQNNKQALPKASQLAAEEFVSSFLQLLPPRLLSRQAWGVDVAIFDNGEFRISEIVTNRGERISWSSYLDQPRVLGAYVRHFETYGGVQFDGLAGSILRNNLGNYFGYWDRRRETSGQGWQKLFSYLPPIP